MSHADIILRYLSERYPAQRFVPLALLLAAAGIVAVPGAQDLRTFATLRSGLLAAFVGYLIVLALRIWDDLEDRQRDAHAHPDRITVRGEAQGSLRYLAVLAASGATLLIATGSDPTPRLLVLALLAAALGVWYRARELSGPPVIAAHVVLIKYPVITYIIAPGTTSSASGLLVAAPVLIAVYLLLCIHEVLDDPELRRSRTARGVLIAESALMVPLVALLIASALELHLFSFGRGSLR